MAETTGSVWSGALGILSAVASALATAVGGPLAGLATRGLIEALGMPAGSTTQEISRRIQGASTEDLAALRAVDRQFAKDMKELDIKLEQMADADRASARTRDPSDYMTKVLATLAVITTTGIVSAIVLGYAKVEGEFAATVVGIVLASYKDVYGFYFGSSAGSRIKDLKAGQG